MSTRTKRLLRRYWGWPALALAIIGWFSGFGWPLLIGLSLISGAYFLLGAPLWCGVPTSRDGHSCRNNSTGILIGCSINHHKKQRLQMLANPGNWGQGLWDSPKDRLNTLAALATVCSFAGSIIGAAG
jgi:hypothetical protein